MTEIESMVKPDGILDDFRWEPMVLIDRLGCIHHVIIHNGELTCQYQDMFITLVILNSNVFLENAVLCAYKHGAPNDKPCLG